LHKSADRLYSQFKPKEAVVELVKILRADSNNFEALVKLARAHIDIGDLVPDNGTNWHERKLKEYTTAQDYARKALQVDPNSTWSHFWIAAAARAQFKAIPEMPVHFSDDAKHKQKAAQLLDEIKGR
jgi:Tfp pilus assembly protein PilF